MKKIIISLIIFITFIGNVFAVNNEKLNISIDKKEISQNEVFQVKLELKLTSTGGNVISPEINLENLDSSLIIVGDSSSTSMEMINNSSKIITSRVFSINPIKEGKFKITGITKNGNQEIKSETLEIKVKKGSGIPNITNPNNILPQSPNNFDKQENINLNNILSTENKENINSNFLQINKNYIILAIIFIAIILIITYFSREQKPQTEPINNSDYTLEENFYNYLISQNIINQKGNQTLEEIHELCNQKGIANISLIYEVINYLKKKKYKNEGNIEEENDLKEKFEKVVFKDILK